MLHSVYTEADVAFPNMKSVRLQKEDILARRKVEGRNPKQFGRPQMMGKPEKRKKTSSIVIVNEANLFDATVVIDLRHAHVYDDVKKATTTICCVLRLDMNQFLACRLYFERYGIKTK